MNKFGLCPRFVVLFHILINIFLHKLDIFTIELIKEKIIYYVCYDYTILLNPLKLVFVFPKKATHRIPKPSLEEF